MVRHINEDSTVMTVTESARFRRRNLMQPLQQSPAKKTRSTLLPVLLSCCLFFAILCACLIAALVFIGNHLYKTDNAYLAQKVFGYNDSSASSNVSETAFSDDIQNLPTLVRLSENYDARPINYDLTLRPDLDSGKFTGQVTITLELKSSTRNLTLNNKRLDINQVTWSNDSKVVDVENVEKDAHSETLSIFSREQLAPGIYNLSISYTGSLLNRTVGLYLSRYKNENGTTRPIATSKFEPTYARQAFPCFDEPNLKATYTVHILKPKKDEYIALSNMPQIGEEEQEDGILVHFQKSVKMSTYLTCFIVCDFEAVQKQILPDSDNVTLKVYATPAQLSKTEYAAKVAQKVTEYFISYFNLPYPLPKLDLIAIPDFVSGAMEHWGLVTFRETALLYDKSISSAANKQRVAQVVAHELAHSWFGNLVTMDWWNDLWLNEGFASYIQYKGVDFVEPEWHFLDQFLTDTLHPILSLDATAASHPIVQTVLTPDEITEIFDTVTYNKGASILRMLEGAVGEEIFRTGVTEYLKAHQYGNAVTQDLLDQLEKLAPEGLNITDFVNTWTVQMGYPILSVTENESTYNLKQTRFLKDPTTKSNSEETPYNYKWTIPVTYITDLEPTKPVQVWFKHGEENVMIPKPDGIKWIKFNPGQVGFYRVNYLSTQWKILSDNISSLSIADKTHLLEESFSIAESGQLSYKIPLDMTNYMKDELAYIPWSVASTKLSQLHKYLSSSLEYSDYLNYIVKLAKPAYSNFTWQEEDEESHLKKRARVTILELMCSIDYEDCLKEAQKRFDSWLQDPVNNKVSQDLRATVYHYGMVNAGQRQWDKLLEVFKKEIDANEKLNMMRGLASVRIPWLLKKLIELGKTEEVIRGQDYFTMLTYVSANSVGSPIVWDYVRENWEYLVKRFTLNDRNLGKLIPSITSSFTTDLRLKEMEDFFAKYPEAGAGTAARKQALANVQNNIKWLHKNKEEVIEWIKEQSKSQL